MVQNSLSPIRRRLLGAVIALGLAATGALVAPLSAQAAASVSISSAVAQILADTNALRAAGGLAPLVESTAMDMVAQNWSAQMYANGAMTHNPSYSTQIPSGWSGAAENIAFGYTAATVVEAWHQSSGHYANIMGNYNAIGIGYYELNGQTYFTQDFGKYTTVPSPAPAASPAPSPTTAAPTSAPVSVYRFWSPTDSSHFYTASASERDSIIANYPASVWTYEGVAYTAFLTQQPGTIPLYRFFSPSLGGHFYTASPSEKNSIIANYSRSIWSYEGVAFYVYPVTTTTPGTMAVSRFWSPSSQRHFYTASVPEKAAVIADYPPSIWTYEGDNYRVPSTPPATSPTAPITPASSTGGFPTRTSAGLPAGWQPVTQITGDYHVRTAGAVVSDLKITNGTIFVEAPNVTLNRIQGIGAYVNNAPGSTCYGGLLVENSTFTPNGTTTDKDDPVIQYGSYTAKNIVIDGAPEGLRVSDGGANCGAVSVTDSFIRVKSPTVCIDWHGDGIQGYGGDKITVRNTTILMQVVNSCYGTSPFFYPLNQGNTAVDIDGLLLGGTSGYPFRNGMPGPIKNLNVVAGSWVYGPVDVNCAATTAFQGQVVTLDAAGQPVSTGKAISCTGQGN